MVRKALETVDRAPARGWVERQKRFYATRTHRHLRYSPGSVYAGHLVQHLMHAAQLPAGSRVLEVGCGAGRFTFDVLQSFDGELVVCDFSETLLDQLNGHLMTFPASQRHRVRIVPGDVYRLESVFGEAQFDAVIGFFFLHHLNDLADALRQLCRLVVPGGQMAFIEPNRRNPLFLLQTLCCPDMSWAEEKGMFVLGRSRIRQAFRSAGMMAPTIRTFGWFPPQILDRWGWAIRVEKRIEQMAFCRGILPFRLIQSRRPAGALGAEAVETGEGMPAGRAAERVVQVGGKAWARHRRSSA
ncbi:MAG: methyltransferase domain-containing protein [Candidatus Omnitrophica bacterium]|nr:methyltransferase domain-containing protein [Candidatus Omnitrophota bacterium]